MEKEIEYKGLVSENIYKELLRRGWDNEILQINFYYSNKNLLKKPNITIRIRCIKEQMFLQIKVKRKQRGETRISHEYEKKIDMIPEYISYKDLRDIWKEYSLGDVKLVGFLVTDRKIIKRNGAEIAVDKNMYEGKTDFEVEIEYEGQSIIVEKIIEDMGLKDNLLKGKGKFERFKESAKTQLL